MMMYVVRVPWDSLPVEVQISSCTLAVKLG